LAKVGDSVVFSSTEGLTRDLIDALKREAASPPRPQAETNSLVEVDAGKVASILSANRAALVRQNIMAKGTGQKEAEAAAGRCAACGHSLLVEGRVQGTGRLYFKPDKTKFWTLAESMVPVRGKVCPACGFIQLFADVGTLRRLSPDRVG